MRLSRPARSPTKQPRWTPTTRPRTVGSRRLSYRSGDRKDKESDPKAKINKIVGDWRDFSTPGAGESIEHGKLLSAKEPKYTAALIDFETVPPELLTAFKAPRFVASETHFSYRTMVMNFIGVRSSAQAMVGLAEVRVIQGRNAEALEELASLVVLGKNMRSQGAVIFNAIGVAISNIAFEAITGLIDPRASISASDWKNTAATFTAAMPSKDQLIVARNANGDDGDHYHFQRRGYPERGTPIQWDE